MEVFALEHVNSYVNQFLVPTLPRVFQPPPKKFWPSFFFLQFPLSSRLGNLAGGHMVDLPCLGLALGVPEWEGGGSYPGTLGLMLASSFVKFASYFSASVSTKVWKYHLTFYLNCLG